MRADTSQLRLPLFALTATSALLAVVGVACGTAPAEPDVGEGSSGLARREIEPIERLPRPPRDAGVKDAAPPPTTRPQAEVAQVPNAGVLLESGGYGNPHRFDMRRRMPDGRTCKAFPAAVVENGQTYLYGTGGRFLLDYLLIAASAPTELKERSCRFTWQRASGAPATTKPDTDKLLLEGSEGLIDRDPDSTFFILPGGGGHCSVCGYASGNRLWAILPPEFPSWYRYRVGGQTYTGQATSAAAEVDEEVLSVPVDVPVEVDLTF